MNQNPTAIAAVISTAVKTVLLAFVTFGILPWTDGQVAAVALAVSTLVDLVIILGIVQPRVTPVANPKATDGTPLVPVGGTPQRVRQRARRR